MEPITREEIEEAIINRYTMRTGRSIGRTLYIITPNGDICIGMVDSPYLAHKFVSLWNSNLGR